MRKPHFKIDRIQCRAFQLAFLGISFVLSSIFLGSNQAQAQSESLYIRVGEAKVRKLKLAVDDFMVGSDSVRGLANQVRNVLLSDLRFSGYFQNIPQTVFPDGKEGVEEGTFSWKGWSQIGSEILIKTKLLRKGNELESRMYIYQTRAKKRLLGKKYESSVKDKRALAHAMANDVVRVVTGKRGIFHTHLAFICDGTGKKELYISDYDGENVIQLTRLQSLVVGPAWAPDGNTLFFSVFRRHRKNIRNIDLMSYHLRTGKLDLISNQKGMNSGAAISPDGKRVALTMSFKGNPEIYSVDLSTKKGKRLTFNNSNDVDPSWSPDGNKIAYVSDRRGKPMVWLMNADGSDKERPIVAGLGAGQYHASPNFSPDGNKLVYSNWEKASSARGIRSSGFNLFTMDLDGNNLQRITKNQGSNEDGSFSPNGEYIVFSSERRIGGRKTQSIYIINKDGSNERQITGTRLGKCTQPRWSNK
jgi:TolB protein